MGKKIFQKKKLKKAVVFGSTGLVGRSLVKQLLDHPEYSAVTCINRREQSIEHSKYKEIIDDLSDTSKLSEFITGEDVFCCLGTTIKKAGSRENFEKVDLELPLAIGKACEQKNVHHYLVVSSIGADAKSGNFYLRTKGTMEEAVRKMNISHKTIVRPSMLLGKRDEFRLGEQIGKVLMKIAAPLMFGNWKKYRAIQAGEVAKAMLVIANSSPSGRVIFESNELHEIADSET